MSDSREVKVPDIGDFDSVDVVEVLVSVGDQVEVDDALITLESDKASMEVPSPVSGVVEKVAVSVGDQVGEGHVIAVLSVGESAGADEAAEPESESESESRVAAADAVAESSSREEAVKPDQDAASTSTAEPAPRAPAAPSEASGTSSFAHASPSVRRMARQLGVDLTQVEGSGGRGRILDDDVRGYVRSVLSGSQSPAAPSAPAATGGGIPAVPDLDFSKFGEVEEQRLGRIRRSSATNLHRSWLNVPHVTQFDEADITELESFRKDRKAEAEARGAKLTPLAFLMKATAAALRDFPDLRSSLHSSGERLIVKNYYHLGVAVDTDNGLVVPVVRDVDRKGLIEIAAELGEISSRARAGELSPSDLSGAVFTISSLGGIGGTGFTPIVNSPQVGILGVARSKWQPVWNGTEFVPRLILPFSLSYDHRVVDGAMAVRFTTHLSAILTDLRRLLL